METKSTNSNQLPHNNIEHRTLRLLKCLINGHKNHLICCAFNQNSSQPTPDSVLIKCALCISEDQTSESKIQVQTKDRTLKVDELKKEKQIVDRTVAVDFDMSERYSTPNIMEWALSILKECCQLEVLKLNLPRNGFEER